jgi:hypothetical protein
LRAGYGRISIGCMTKTKLVSLALATSIAVSVPALAAHPKRSAGWGDRGDSTTSQGDKGIIRLATNSEGKVFDFAFSYGCKTDTPPVDVNRSTRQYFKNRRHPAVKVSDSGKFAWKGKLKTFVGVSSFDTGGPYKTATVVLRGKFVTRRRAEGSFTLTEAGCSTGKVTWTAKAH